MTEKGLRRLSKELIELNEGFNKLNKELRQLLNIGLSKLSRELKEYNKELDLLDELKKEPLKKLCVLSSCFFPGGVVIILRSYAC